MDEAAIVELRVRAAKLRAGAYGLLDDTGLIDVMREAVGPIAVVGSVDFDLMVWPDIDLNACLEPDQGNRFVELIPAVYEHLGRQGWTVVKASFNDEYRRPGSAYDGGLYLGFLILPPNETWAWKIDLWGWGAATIDEKRAEHRQWATALATVDRDLVLRIKDAVWQRPEYRKTLTSVDVYTFLIEGAGSTVAELDAYLARTAAEDHRS